MADQIVRLGPEYFPRPTSGIPVAGGSIYIGEPDTDPVIPANQISVSALQENGSTVVISQPISTGGGGVPLYNGSPVTLLVSESYSLKILDSFGSQVYYVSSTDVPVDTQDPVVEYIKDIIGLINIISPSDDQTHTILSFFDGLNSGGGSFYWDSTTDKATANGCTVIDPDNIGGFDGTQPTLPAYFAAQGAGVGFGCWILVQNGTIFVTQAGAVGDGIADDTSSFVAALAAAADGGLYIPKSSVKYLVDSLTEGPPSNIYIFLEPGTIIEARPGYAADEQVMRIWNKNNVTISGYGATIQMPKAEYTSGEFRHCIDMRGSTNIHIEGIACNDSGGDGFLMGSGDVPYCQNIVLKDVSADNNRRQGLSIVSVKGLRVTNSRFTNTTGTLPSAGIDIEPNDNDEFLEDIVLDNIYTEGNDGLGIAIALFNFLGAVDKTVSIEINNPHDVGSGIGLRITKVFLDGNELSGKILINNPLSVDAEFNGLSVENYDVLAPVINIYNPVCVRPNASGQGAIKYGTAFVVFRESTDTGAASIGNVNIYNPTFRDDRAVPLSLAMFYSRDLTAVNFTENVNVLGTINHDGSLPIDQLFEHFGSGIIEDITEQLIYDMADADYSLNVSNYVRRITNKTSVATRIVALEELPPPDWPKVTFEVLTPYLLRIDPAGSSAIIPGSLGAGKYIESNDTGARLTLRRKSALAWVIEEEIGTWTREV